MRLIDADALKAYIDAQKGRPFIGCTIGEALKIMTDEQPTVEKRKTGKWTEKDVVYKPEASETIEEWQSARCSVCGKYHTTPYMYYFTEYKYCPHCGSRMENIREVKDNGKTN